MEKASKPNFLGKDSIFAIRLNQLMLKHKKTQQDIAQLVGTSRQAISQYIDGQTQPTIEKLYKIANFFNVSADYLLGLTDIESVDIYDKKISELIGLNDEAINNLRTTNEDNKINIQVVNDLLNKNIGGVKVLKTIQSYLEFDNTTYSAMPDDLIKAYNGKIYTIDGEKMELILLTQVQDKLRQLKDKKGV